MSTPYKWTKQVAGYLGGMRNGMVISWPGHIKDAGGIRNQFHHVIDIVPTILEATGIEAPDVVDGIDQAPIEGVSLAYTFDKANADAPSRHRTQYFEMFGERALYHDGWMASTVPFRAPWNGTAPTPKDVVNDAKWELYDLTKDWTQNNDVAAANPTKLKELQDLFWVEAAKYQVLPLDASALTRFIAPRPSIVAGRDEFTYTQPARRHAARNGAEHSQQVVLDQRRDRGARRRRRRHARHPGRPLRRLGPLPPQGQAGLRLQSAGPRAAADRGAAGSVGRQAHRRLRLHL